MLNKLRRMTQVDDAPAALPVRAADPREADLDRQIAALHTEERAFSREAADLKRTISELLDYVRASTFSAAPVDRAEAREQLAAKTKRLDVVNGRLVEINAELAEAQPACARVRAEVDAAIAGQLKPEAVKIAGRIDAAARALLAALDDGQKLIDHADRQLSDPTTHIYMGARGGLSTNALGALRPFAHVGIDAERLAEWQNEAVAEGLL
jgi:hypothetical protein